MDEGMVFVDWAGRLSALASELLFYLFVLCPQKGDYTFSPAVDRVARKKILEVARAL